MTATNGLVDELIDQLSVKTVFTIPIFGGIKIAESVVVMWIIMAIVIVASIFLTRKLSVENPGKRQLFLEVCIGKFYGFFEGLLGEEGKCYIPYLMSVGLFIGIANVIGLFGFKPPTKDLNCTIALALMSIILVEAAGIRAKGVKKWAKGFTQPVAIITPIRIWKKNVTEHCRVYRKRSVRWLWLQRSRLSERIAVKSRMNSFTMSF